MFMSKTSISVLAFLSMFLLALSACGGDDGDDDGMMNPTDPFGACPSDSTSQEMMGAMLIAAECNNCHSSSLTGSARNGAPSSRNFDTASDVMANAARIHARVQAGTMPPGTGLNSDQQEAVRVYLACGITSDPSN